MDTQLRNHTYTRPVPATTGQYLFLPLNHTKWRLVDVTQKPIEPVDLDEPVVLLVKDIPVTDMIGKWKTIDGLEVALDAKERREESDEPS